MNTLRVAYFLAWRQILRTNIRSVFLIIAVMTLTFLNLVAVSGILVGLIEGASVAFRAKLIGDLEISALENKKEIRDAEEIVGILKSMTEVSGFSMRYTESGTMESNFNNRDASKRRELASGNINGIEPEMEAKVTGWNKDIIEGEFLEKNDTGKIVVGKNLLAKYAIAPQDAERALGEVGIGDRLLVSINNNTNEFILKGVLNGKTDATRQAYISINDMKKLLDSGSSRPTVIAVRVKSSGDEKLVKDVLVNNGLNIGQKIETYEEAEPSFVKDLSKVFEILGTAIGSIGLVVAFITIFIVIYINAITRRKYIGIMKAVGVSPTSIEISYIMQSCFYGLTGSFLGALIVYFVLVPYFLAYPINFPFSDGIMVAPYMDTFIKFLILMVSTILAGYLPSRSIIKQNTLNAILGR